MFLPLVLSRAVFSARDCLPEIVEHPLIAAITALNSTTQKIVRYDFCMNFKDNFRLITSLLSAPVVFGNMSPQSNAHLIGGKVSDCKIFRRFCPAEGEKTALLNGFTFWSSFYGYRKSLRCVFPSECCGCVRSGARAGVILLPFVCAARHRSRAAF